MTPREYKLYLPWFNKIQIILGITFSICLPLTLLVFSFFQMGPPIYVAIFTFIFGAFPLYFILSIPYRIAVQVNQEIVFISLLGKQAVHASDILSVRPHGAQYGLLIIRYPGGKMDRK